MHKKYSIYRYLVLMLRCVISIQLLAVFMYACAGKDQSSNSSSLNQPIRPPLPGSQPHAAPLLVPIRDTITTTSAPTEVHELVLNKQIPNWLLLNTTHIYWTTSQDLRHIFRYPLADGEVQIAATSVFTDGDLTTMRPVLNEHRLIFLDTPSSSQNTSWEVRTIDLRNGLEQTIIKEVNDPSSWPGPAIDADGDWMVWTSTKYSKNENCTQTILTVRNLQSSEQYALDRTCAENTYMWVNPHLYDNKLVVEQDLPDNKGGGNNIYIFDLVSGQRTSLTKNNQSSMPAIANSWVAWKAGSRFKLADYTVIYNLQNTEKYAIRNPIQDSSDPLATNHWLYWLPPPKQPLYIYDMISGHMLKIATPKEKESISSVAIFKNMVVWSLNNNFEDINNSDNSIRWGNIN